MELFMIIISVLPSLLLLIFSNKLVSIGLKYFEVYILATAMFFLSVYLINGINISQWTIYINNMKLDIGQFLSNTLIFVFNSCLFSRIFKSFNK